jgi:hypothetical protein
MIRLLTVIGHGTTLLPHFIKHYQQYVDEINIAVYETDMFPTLANEVSQIIGNQDNVKILKVIKDRVFDWVIADIDELHLYPNDNLNYLVDNCEKYGYQLVRGGFIDRIGEGGEFTEIVPEVSLFDQFPNAGFFRYPMSKACPNKVCVMKGHIEITSGQHYAKILGQTTWRWQGWNHPLINPHSFVQVHHFKWDSTSIERIQAVANLKQEYAYSDEYKLMYDQLRKSRFKIDLNNPEFMFEKGENKFRSYKQWDKLIKTIISI